MAVMWEAQAAPGRADDLLAHVLAHVAPAAEVYRSADGRVVVIDPTEQGVPDVPAELMARPAHFWRFEHVPRKAPEQ